MIGQIYAEHTMYRKSDDDSPLYKQIIVLERRDGLEMKIIEGPTRYKGAYSVDDIPGSVVWKGKGKAEADAELKKSFADGWILYDPDLHGV